MVSMASSVEKEDPPARAALRVPVIHFGADS
jgi:hypothetical protein